MAIFAYHKTYEHGEFWHTYYWTKSARVKVGDILYVISGDLPKKPTYFLEGRYRVVSVEPPDKDAFRKLNLRPEVKAPRLSLNAQSWFDNSEFHKIFTSGQSMNTVRQDYVDRFDRMLRPFEGLDSLLDDLQSIENLNIDATERETLALARVGQGVFRANVISAWGLGEACAVTGIRLRSILVASHVRSWRDCRTGSERLDGANGILLCAHLDRLLDKRLISFADDGAILFGKTLQEDNEAVRDLAFLGVTIHSRLNLERIDSEAYKRLTAYLGEHRSCFQ